MTIKELVEEMVKNQKFEVRRPVSWSWGDHTQCRNLFVTIFKEVDTTLREYKHLPEYEQVVDWMTDTADRGLLLMGDCGRGKSVIISGVVPVLLRLKNFCMIAVHAQDIAKPLPYISNGSYNQRPESYLDYLLKCRFPIIDEIGVESLINDYGEKSEGFNSVMNAAERFHRPLFLTTNLTAEQLLERYGERTIDRLNHLCRIIEFKGDSLRK